MDLHRSQAHTGEYICAGPMQGSELRLFAFVPRSHTDVQSSATEDSPLYGCMEQYTHVNEAFTQCTTLRFP